MEYPGVRLGQRGGLFDLYQYYLGGGDESQDTDDTGPVTQVPTTTVGDDRTNTMGIDLNKIRQPTGSPFRTDISNVTDTGEKFSNLPTTDPRYMSEAEQIFLQNRADAGAFAYDSPMYSGGAPGNIVQSGPGRQFTGDEAMFVGDPRTQSEDEDEGLIASIRSNILNNPLALGIGSLINPGFAFARTAGKSILDSLGNMLPVNARAIQEKEGLTQGIAIDDIGRVAFQDFGIKEDGTYGALGRDDPRNIFAGLNYSKIDQDTIDKMKARIDKGLMKTNPELAKKRLSIIDDAWKTKQMADSEAEKIISRREYERREEKRAKIQKDLAAAGFGEAGAVGLDPDMDKQIFDDYTYTPPSRDDTPKAPPAKPKQTTTTTIQDTSRDDRPTGGGGGASYGTRSESGWASSPFKKGGLVKRKPYGDGGIVDLL